jgi:hypothetical protein
MIDLDGDTIYGRVAGWLAQSLRDYLTKSGSGVMRISQRISYLLLGR